MRFKVISFKKPNLIVTTHYSPESRPRSESELSVGSNGFISALSPEAKASFAGKTAFHYKHCVLNNSNSASPDELLPAVKQFVKDIQTKNESHPTAVIPLPKVMLDNIVLLNTKTRLQGDIERRFYAFHQIIELIAAPVFNLLASLKDELNHEDFKASADHIVDSLSNMNSVMAEFNHYITADEFSTIRPYLTDASGAQLPTRFFSKYLYGEYSFSEPGFETYLKEINKDTVKELLEKNHFQHIDTPLYDFMMPQFKGANGYLNREKSRVNSDCNSVNTISISAYPYC